MAVYKCPTCGAMVRVEGRCWVCHYCGEEACGLGGLEMEEEDEA